MGLHEAKDIESRFTRYVEGLVRVIGHADRAGPLHDYCLGLVMPGERKSVEPMGRDWLYARRGTMIACDRLRCCVKSRSRGTRRCKLRRLAFRSEKFGRLPRDAHPLSDDPGAPDTRFRKGTSSRERHHAVRLCERPLKTCRERRGRTLPRTSDPVADERIPSPVRLSR